MTHPTVAGAILAGGESRRMGRDKSRLEIDGRPQLQRMLEAMAGHLSQVVVSLAYGSSLPIKLTSVLTVRDEISAAGPLAGIVACSGRLPGRALLVASVDLLGFTGDLVRVLLESWDSARPVALARDSGTGFEPLCAIWTQSALAEATLALANGMLRPHAILDRHDVTICPRPRSPLVNANTPDDLRRYSRLVEAYKSTEVSR